MAKGLNNIQVIGNLGRDPEEFARGSRFTVAANDTYMDREGNRIEKTQWFNVKAFDKLGGVCQEYLHKGDRVFIQGRMESRDYEGQDGQMKTIWEVVARDMVMLSEKRSDGPRRQSGPTHDWDGEETKYPPTRPSPAPAQAEFDDDIPF